MAWRCFCFRDLSGDLFGSWDRCSGWQPNGPRRCRRSRGFYGGVQGVHASGQGVLTVKCINCHQVQNQQGPHMPPGAGYPLKELAEHPARRAEPRWHLPPAATPMIFERRTPGQLCRQLLDRKKNGGLTAEQLVDHVNHDPLVSWGWNPGEGRSTPPLSHEEFVGQVREWVNKGGACPN
jgi:hypothetical protein